MKEIITMVSEARTADEMRALEREMQNMVNNFGFNPKEFVEEAFKNEKAKTTLTALAVKWVKYWGEAPDFMTDPRNEISTMICRMIAGHPSFGTVYKKYAGYPDDTTEAFIAQAPRIHKTLVQSMTSLFLRVLYELQDGDAADIEEMLRWKYGNDWYRLPLI